MTTTRLAPTRSQRRALLPGLCLFLLVLGGKTVGADIVIYWKGLGGTWQVGTVQTDVAWVGEEGTNPNDDSVSSKNDDGTESHIAIVCGYGVCDVTTLCGGGCHTTPKPPATFNGRVATRHTRDYFPRSTVAVGTTAVAYHGGLLRTDGGRLTLSDVASKERHRMPAGARLLRGSRSGQPLFVVYNGMSKPERVP